MKNVQIFTHLFRDNENNTKVFLPAGETEDKAYETLDKAIRRFIHRGYYLPCYDEIEYLGTQVSVSDCNGKILCKEDLNLMNTLENWRTQQEKIRREEEKEWDNHCRFELKALRG